MVIIYQLLIKYYFSKIKKLIAEINRNCMQNNKKIISSIYIKDFIVYLVDLSDNKFINKNLKLTISIKHVFQKNEYILIVNDKFIPNKETYELTKLIYEIVKGVYKNYFNLRNKNYFVISEINN
jgi:hypothetical protein